MAETFRAVPRSRLRAHVMAALERYWPVGGENVETLRIAKAAFPATVTSLRPRYISVPLPDWAKRWGVDGLLLVPEETCVRGREWRHVDWWLAAFLMIECWHERIWELRYGPIHSYRFKLKGWDRRIWQRAWVNRVALFLRTWAAHEKGKAAQEIFGPLPQTEMVMTHDVDAVTKTLPIRLKQSLFNLFNAWQGIIDGNPRRAAASIKRMASFLIGGNDWWTLDKLLAMEQTAGIQGHFNFHVDHRKKNLRRWIFDPGYDFVSDRLRKFVKRAHTHGWTIGLHPSVDAWRVTAFIQAQKQSLEKILGHSVSSCRQHWLRFSWQDTWTAQEKTGLELDTTLMFNDCPGFRNSSALLWNPWNAEAETSHTLKALPTVFMDSHFYDYQSLTDEVRKRQIAEWIQEIKAVAGQAALLWHPHTLSETYGWEPGFRDVLHAMKLNRSSGANS